MVVSSWVVSARTLLLVRSAILVFCTISLLVMIDPVHNGVGAIGGAFFWFTNWGFILLTLYFGQAVAYTLRGPPPESSAAQPQTAWQTAIWLNFEIAGMSAIFIDVVLWGILWPSSGFDAMFFHPMMLIVHGANFFIVALEMALNRIPVHKDHYFAVVGYTAIYGLFATFEHLVLYDGRRWPCASFLTRLLFSRLALRLLTAISLGPPPRPPPLSDLLCAFLGDHLSRLIEEVEIRSAVRTSLLRVSMAWLQVLLHGRGAPRLVGDALVLRAPPHPSRLLVPPRPHRRHQGQKTLIQAVF